MGTYKGYEYSETRVNEYGEIEYNIDGEWCTKEDLDERKSQEKYWEEWAADLDRQDEDPSF